MRPGGIPARLSLRAVCRLSGAGPAPPCARAQAAPRRGGAGRGDGGVQRPFLPFDDERPGNGAHRRGLPGAERGLGGGGDGGGRAGLSPRPHPPGKAGPGFVRRVPRAGEPVNKWICARLQNPVK